MIEDKQNTVDLLKKKARAKFFTHSYIFKLIDMNSVMEKSYWQTYHCASAITQNDTKFTAQYCNQRWCTVCNRIRIAKFVNAYGNELKDFFEPHFITLTVPNCTKEDLKATILKMDKDFQKLNDTLKKRKIKLKGIRKTEITYNHTSDTYHPHFHLIVENFPTLFNCENHLDTLYYVK
jgi:plasmid rolling circle replication initiator protein Rep